MEVSVAAHALTPLTALVATQLFPVLAAGLATRTALPGRDAGVAMGGLALGLALGLSATVLVLGVMPVGFATGSRLADVAAAAGDPPAADPSTA